MSHPLVPTHSHSSERPKPPEVYVYRSLQCANRAQFRVISGAAAFFYTIYCFYYRNLISEHWNVTSLCVTVRVPTHAPYNGLCLCVEVCDMMLI